MSPARLGRVLIEDVAVPRTQLAAAVREITAIAERRHVRIFTFAHAADAPPPHPRPRPRSPGIPDAAWQAAGDIFTSALRLGGTLTGKHGVGTLKRSWLAQELGPEQHALQHLIKAAFDPHHILNPDKALWGGVVVEPAAREALDRIADQFLAALGGRVSLEAAA